MGNLPKMIMVIVGCAVILMIILLILACIGATPFLGCYLRYANPGQQVSTSVSAQVNANGRYDGVNCNPGDETCPQAQYGKWLRVNLNIKRGARVTLDINGQVSLCQAYTADSSSTPIPRVARSNSGDDGTIGVPIILPAGSKAIPIANIYTNDLIQVRVGANAHANNISVFDRVNNKLISADCTDGKNAYSPLCGRYSFYAGMHYYQNGDCQVRNPQDCGASASNRNRECQGYKVLDDKIVGDCNCILDIYFLCDKKRERVCYRYNPSGILPQNYSDSSLIPASGPIDLRSKFLPPEPRRDNPNCPNGLDTSILRSWLTFSDFAASGLTYQIGQSAAQSAYLLNDCQEAGNPLCEQKTKRYILNEQAKASGNLRYQFFDTGNEQNYTGGYVIYVKQTKCYRTSGEYFQADSDGDQFAERGKVEYLLLRSGDDPNKNPSFANAPLGLVFNKGSAVINSIDTDGYLWLKIRNLTSDYPHSVGQYNFSISHAVDSSSSTRPDVWGWISELFIKKWQNAAKNIFQNLTCKGSADKSSCINMLNVIRAFLIAYIVIFGLGFAIGTIHLGQMDFLIRVLKVVIIGGLISDNTFNFFNLYLFDLIFNATAEIMTSIIGVGNNLEGALSSYFHSVYDLIFAEIFSIQLLALLGTGLNGLILFVLVVIALIFFLIAVFEFVVVYVLSSVSVAVLLSLAPLFLTFMLFDFTKHLFDNWLRYILRYIFEPVIMFIGVFFLTQMFLIYIDYVLGYSVCWKCNAPFQIPFLDAFFPFLANLKTVPIFCIYWLSPWGYDAISYNFASALTNVVSLFCIAFCALKYAGMSTKVCDSIFGPSAGSFGTAGSVSKELSRGAVENIEKMKSASGGSGKKGKAPEPKR